MLNGLSLEYMLKYIDNMNIYEKDYDVIKALLNTDKRFFTKVMEEIMLDEVRISDFERVLNDDYSNLLRDNIPTQKKLISDIKKHIDRINTLNTEAIMSVDEYSKSNVYGIPYNNDDILKPLYNTELADIRYDLLYNLFGNNKSNSDILDAGRLRLYTDILNYKSKSNDDYIDPNDLLLFINDAVLPIDYNAQILTVSDLNYMASKGLSESQMKKIKAYSQFIRREISLTDNGGSNE